MTDTKTSADLLPCPFCGSGDVGFGSTGSKWQTVACNECGAEGPCTEINRDLIIGKWNTRTPAPIADGGVREPVAWRYRYKAGDCSVWMDAPAPVDASPELKLELAYSAPQPAATEREQMLADALKNMMGAYDTPLSRRRFPQDGFMKEAVESGRSALRALAQPRSEGRS